MKNVTQLLQMIIVIIIMVCSINYPIYIIDSISMQETFAPKDIVIGEKKLFGNFEVRRNDIVVFEKDNETLIKRCIGIPGDVISILDDDFIINSIPENSKRFLFHYFVPNVHQIDIINYRLGYDIDFKLSIDRSGNVIYIFQLSWEEKALLHEIDRFDIHMYYCYFESKNIFQLNEDEYFVVGDNRSYSNDSRVFGPIQRQNILSKIIKKL